MSKSESEGQRGAPATEERVAVYTQIFGGRCDRWRVPVRHRVVRASPAKLVLERDHDGWPPAEVVIRGAAKVSRARKMAWTESLSVEHDTVSARAELARESANASALIRRIELGTHTHTDRLAALLECRDMLERAIAAARRIEGLNGDDR
jgi:hypothetical protein